MGRSPSHGAMFGALGNLTSRVRRDGLLLVAIYNDQGWQSRVWHGVKRRYNRSGRTARAAMLGVSAAYFYSRSAVAAAARVRRRDGVRRGMSRWHDLVDWVGGY